MTDHLVAYLGPIDSRLLGYLDESRDLSLPTVEHLYRYGVALLQGHILPEDVMEDWEDFFHLAGGFVFAHGSERLSMSARSSSVLWVGRTPAPLSDSDRTLLVDLVREMGELLARRTSAAGGGSERRSA